MGKKNILLPQDLQILKNQNIDEKSPSTIVRDFETLLAFIGTNGIEVSGTYNFFILFFPMIFLSPQSLWELSDIFVLSFWACPV